jgi:hypothetical protein
MRRHTIQESKMAPSAVETSMTTDRPHVNPTVKLTGGRGSYEELFPIRYVKEDEEKGRDGFDPAKVDNTLSIPNLTHCNGIRRPSLDI